MTTTLPLAERLRPKDLAEVFGQPHLTSDAGLITKIIKGKRPLSILLWGPPGSGKTTIARLYAQAFESQFISFSAIFHSITDLKKIVTDIKENPLFKRQTILFVDEIHRFNKAQQDAFLPYIEDGTLIVIGATTENPSFALNKALLSRMRVVEVKPLGSDALAQIVKRFETQVGPLNLTPRALQALLQEAQGDGRHLLNMLENILHCGNKGTLDCEELAELIQKRAPVYDRDGDGHYNLISALHKSIRASDPDASLYYLARMLVAGEDPQYILRRLTRVALEDIGLADPSALTLAISSWDTFQRLGLKEGELALAQLTLYLALAPKSNAAYVALDKAKLLAQKTSHLSPPLHSLNAPTSMMKEMGYGKEYQYDHSNDRGFSGQNHFPDGLKRESFYQPVERGFEREMKKRLDYFEKLREKKE